MVATEMNHSAYIARTKKMTDSSLRYVIDDAKAAMKANPENPKCSYYADEICYCGMELKRREVKNGKK